MLGRHVNIKEIENMNVNEYVEIEIERSQIEKSEQKTCAWCKSPIGKNPWSGKDTIWNLQKVCNPCWDEASEYDMKWGH